MSGSKKDRSAGRRSIQVQTLARVEGEGALHLTMCGDEVEELQLQIYEPPRFFEAFLRGRDFREVPDITARICGICPVAYQMSSCHALEKAMGVFDQVDPAIRALRNVLYCGEWIESHILHMFLLHLPDFLGFESAISMAADHAALVKRALRIKKAGNDILTLLAGRAVHPVGVCVGGFYRAPDPAAATQLVSELRMCLDDMSELTLFLARHVTFPTLERDYEFVSLCADDAYPMNLGRIKSSKGLNVDQEEFGRAIEEHHVAHCNSLHAVMKDRGPYLVGPLARLNLNAARLLPRAAELLPQVCQAVRTTLPWRNNYLSLLARSLECVHALELAASTLASYTPPIRPRVPIVPRAGIGCHGTEAPRGLCWHEYRTDADGLIASARIIPPTSQNYATIEADLRTLAPQIATLPDEEATLRCEHVIRNYDPCISCSVHFLTLDRHNR